MTDAFNSILFEIVILTCPLHIPQQSAQNEIIYSRDKAKNTIRLFFGTEEVCANQVKYIHASKYSSKFKKNILLLNYLTQNDGINNYKLEVK